MKAPKHFGGPGVDQLSGGDLRDPRNHCQAEEGFSSMGCPGSSGTVYRREVAFVQPEGRRRSNEKERRTAAAGFFAQERRAPANSKSSLFPLTTIDLFCGAGGITEGFREAGYGCLYANDCMPEAIETFSLNHPEAWSEAGDIEDVDPAQVRKRLGLKKGALDVLVGGPPCQGFSINAPERFLSDPRNKLFKDYLRFLEEFEPKAFLFENVPGLLSLGDGKVFRQIVREFEEHGYHVTAKILFAAHYGVPQERWRLILLGSRTSEIAPPKPTHYATGRANFRGGGTMTFQLDRRRQEAVYCRP